MVVSSERFMEIAQSALGFSPELVAVMGKWEPFLGEARCLSEVRSRAAAALALAEGLDGPKPLLISVEGKLRGQPKPGCHLCADLLLSLGAPADRVWLWPAANRTQNEIAALRRARRLLGAGGLVLVTSDYHQARVGQLLRDQPSPPAQVAVVGTGSPLVQSALAQIPAPRRRLLQRAISEAERSRRQRFAGQLSERIAVLGQRLSLLEGVVADLVRGRVQVEAAGLVRADGQPRRISPA